MLQLPLSRFAPRRRTTSHRDSFQLFRSVLAMGLAALLFLAPLSFRVSAQESVNSSKPTQTHQFTIYQDENGNVVCRAATPAERLQSDNIDTSTQGLRQINHLKREYTDYAHSAKAQTGTNDSTGLTIILRATTQLQANQPALDAFNRAAQNWEKLIQSPVTIYIDVDYGSTNFGTAWPDRVLGSTSTPSHAFPYQSVRANLIAEANGEGNATKQAIFNALPSTNVPTDLGNASTVDVTDSTARALGLLNQTALSTDSASKIAFNSGTTHPFDFDPTDGITPGQTDFDAVATHEIGHALGFDSDAGEGLSRPSIWDLYRFRTGTTSGTFTTAQRIMTIGGSPDALQFDFIPGNPEMGLSTGGPNGATTTGGDGWQSSHWKHASQNGGVYVGIMDPAIAPGVRRQITPNDTLALTSFGYNLNNSATPPPPPPPPTPPANDNFANAQAISGCSGSITGTNVGATKETGEPNNPDSPTSIPSVWYQWTAPSTGSVTIDTHGSDFDTVLAIYTGNSVGALSLISNQDGVGHNDDATPGSDVTSSVTFPATQGQTYRIAVNGYNNQNSGGDIGNIKLNWNASNCSTQPTTPTITWSNPADITYGTTLSGTQLNATASVPGTFTYTPALGTLLNAGSGQTLSVNFAPTDATNYTSASKSVQINVLKGQATISITNLTQTYDGTAKSPTVTTAPAGLSGLTVTYNGSSSLPVNVGSYQVVASLSNINYQTANPIGAMATFTIVGTAPTVQFTSSSYTVGEGDGHATITVNRSDSTAAASVGYATSDTAGLQNCNVINGIASSRCDYVTAIGTLNFAIGESSKTISIPIVDDAFAEGNESFNIALSNPVGATLGTNSSATITIIDNDPVTGANPISNVAFFVRQHYIDFLGREPDDFGFTGWQNSLNNCAAGDTTCDRIEVSSDFFRSPEFQDRGYFTYRFYDVAFGRKPFYAEFMPDIAKVSGFLSTNDLEANKVAFVQDFMSRAEFKNRYDSTIGNPTAYVDALLQTAGLPNHPTRGTWITNLTNGSMTRGQVLRAIVESAEVNNKFYTEAFVVMQYFGYLRREPDANYTILITQMNQSPTNYRNMINIFVNSSEYRARFGP